MGNVVISPNIKKTSARIDPAGNVIDAKTKQVVEPVEVEYVPPVVEPVTQTAKSNSVEAKVGSKIDEIINRKVEELVARKVEEALSKL